MPKELLIAKVPPRPHPNEKFKLHIYHSHRGTLIPGHLHDHIISKKGVLTLWTHHESLRTPAKLLNTSPTPMPSLPTFFLIAWSLCSRFCEAVSRTLFAQRSAVFLYCSILWTPSAKISIFGSSESDRLEM